MAKLKVIKLQKLGVRAWKGKAKSSLAFPSEPKMTGHHFLG